MTRPRDTAANGASAKNLERGSRRGFMVALALLALALGSVPASAFDGRMDAAAGPGPPSPTQNLITVTTNYAGLQVQVDDVWHTAPYVLSCEPSTTHWVNTTTPQIGGPEMRYVFEMWSDGSPSPSHIITCDASGTLTAFFVRQYLVTLDSDPPGLPIILGGTEVMSPFPFWCNEGEVYVLMAMDPIPSGNTIRFRFRGWSDGNISTSRVFYCVGSNRNIAMYSTEYLLTFDTFTTDLQLVVDGVQYVAPFELWCSSGATLAVSAPPQSGGPGTRYVFVNWSDDSTLTLRSITCDAPTTVIANFQTQYLVTASTIPAGLDFDIDGRPVVTPSTFWCAEGSVHVVTAADPIRSGANERFRFDGWSDGNHSNPRVFVCSGPMDFTAIYHVEYLLTFDTSPTGLQLVFDGTVVTAPQSFWWADGSIHAIVAPSPQDAGNGTRYVFDAWSDGGPRERTIEVSGPATLVAKYNLQFRLIFASPYGSPSCDAAGCWYDAGATAFLSISETEVTEGGRRYRFVGWTGDLTAGAPDVTLLMDGPRNVTASWEELAPQGLTAAQWLGIGGAAFAGVLGAGLALSEPFHVALALLFVALYARLRREDVLDNEKRGMVRGYLAANPGANFAAIRDDLKMATGTLAYHLQVLEREGVVKSWTDGRFKRFALSDHPIAEIEPKLTDIELILLQDLRKNPGRTQRDLAAVAGLSQPTVSYHMEKMATMGVVGVRREGWRRRYFASLREPSASAAAKGGDPPGAGRT